MTTRDERAPVGFHVRVKKRADGSRESVFIVDGEVFTSVDLEDSETRMRFYRAVEAVGARGKVVP